MAGAILVLNAILNLAFTAKMTQSSDKPGVNPFTSMVIDVVVGAGLLMGKARWHKWALVRVFLGALVFGGVYLVQGDYVTTVVQVMLSGALLLLLLGDPGKLRIASGSTLAAAYLFLVVVGIVTLSGGSNPVAASVLAAKGEIAPVGQTLTGERFGYCMDVPKQWFLRTAEAAHKDNSMSDRWLIRPDIDAHVLVIGEELSPDMRVVQSKFEGAILSEMKTTLKDFQLVGQDQLRNGEALHATGSVGGIQFEYYRGLFAEANRGFQVIAFAQPRVFAEHRDELTGMVRSFRTNCGTSAR